jgi:hypothetical protein
MSAGSPVNKQPMELQATNMHEHTVAAPRQMSQQADAKLNTHMPAGSQQQAHDRQPPRSAHTA